VSAPVLTVTPQAAQLSVVPAAPELELAAPVARLTIDAAAAPDLTVVHTDAPQLHVAPVVQPTLAIEITPARLDLASEAPQGPSSDSVHDARDTLVHSVAESSDVELAYDVDGQLTRSTTWTSAAHTTRIRETVFTYVDGDLTESVTRQYDASGTVVATLTSAFVYDVGGDLIGVEKTLT